MLSLSAFQLATQTTQDQRLLPVLFNLDYVKTVQHSDRGWKLPPRPEGQRLEAKEARELFQKCMRGWDEPGTDRAIVNLYAQVERDELFELVWPWALRDFRFIGHKPIYAAAIYRAVGRIGWKHGLPLLRSMALGLLDGCGQNRAWTATFRSNRKLAKTMKEIDWAAGKPNPDASMSLLAKLRTIPVNDAGEMVAEWLLAGISPASIWDGLRLYAAEMLTRERGILGVHLTTSINALHFIWKTTSREQTKRLAILQAASWMPMFREDFTHRRRIRWKDSKIDTLTAADEAPATAKILDVYHADRPTAASQVLLAAGNDSTKTLEECFRRLVFRKGTESHVYKYSAAMLEEFHHAHPQIAPRILAAGAFYLPMGKQADAPVYTRACAALEKLLIEGLPLDRRRAVR